MVLMMVNIFLLAHHNISSQAHMNSSGTLNQVSSLLRQVTRVVEVQQSAAVLKVPYLDQQRPATPYPKYHMTATG